MERTPRQVLRTAHDGLIVLTFLAKCDGEMHPSEIDVVQEYLLEFPGGEGVDPEMVELHMLRMWPDPEAYAAALLRLADREDELVLTAGFAVELIAADGRITPEEAEFIELLREVLPSE